MDTCLSQNYACKINVIDQFRISTQPNISTMLITINLPTIMNAFYNFSMYQICLGSTSSSISCQHKMKGTSRSQSHWFSITNLSQDYFHILLSHSTSNVRLPHSSQFFQINTSYQISCSEALLWMQLSPQPSHTHTHTHFVHVCVCVFRQQLFLRQML